MASHSATAAGDDPHPANVLSLHHPSPPKPPSPQQTTWRTLLLLCAALLGCFGASPRLAYAPAQPASDQRVALGELTLLVRADPWRLSLLGPSGTPVWDEAPDQTLGYQTRDGHVWRARRLASTSPLDDGAIQLVAETDDPAGRALTIEAQPLGPHAFRLRIVPDPGGDATSIDGAFVTTDDERFVGFGERFDGVNQRGRVVDVWADDRRVAGYGPSTYAPLPLLLSSHGHGFALERVERSRFDLASSRPDRWSWQQDAASASVLVSYGPSLKELVQRNAELTGLPPLPPNWLFGVWKTSIGGQDEVTAEVRRLRALGVPLSAVFAFDAVDAEANIGWPYVTFAGRHAGPYPDPAAFTDQLHQLGFKVLNYFTADFHLDRPNFAEPAARGFLVKNADGQPYIHPGFKIGWLDFTNPDAVAWWGNAWRRALVHLGFDGGMLDLGELLPPDAVFADGTNGLETHNRYPRLYAQAAWQQASAVRPDGDFALVLRSGALGAQRFQSAQWNGDAVMRWEAPDGLRSMVPAAVSFGLGGFPYWHTEVAGYVQADLSHEQERELWLRWLQLSTWTALLRDHYGDHPREPIDVWLDEGTLSAFASAARVHSSLFPYLYSLAVEASRTGVPMLRFLPLEVPDDPRAWQEEQSYFLGPVFLVAPVTDPGATSREVYLPAGDWVDYWRGTLYQGGQSISVPAPLDGDGPPVFVRAGALVPLAADYDSLVPASDPNVQTYAGDLVVRIMPGSPADPGVVSFTLYDGTRLAWTGSALTIDNNPAPRTIELRLPDGRVFAQRVEDGQATIATENN